MALMRDQAFGHAPWTGAAGGARMGAHGAEGQAPPDESDWHPRAADPGAYQDDSETCHDGDPAHADGHPAELRYGAASGADTGGLVGTVFHGAGALLSLGLVIGLAVWGYGLVVRDVSGVPVVRAASGPMRVAPEDAGGRVAPFQGLSVNVVAAEGGVGGTPGQVVVATSSPGLAPDDLPAAQLARSAAARDGLVPAGVGPAVGDGVVAPGARDGLIAGATGTEDAVMAALALALGLPQPGEDPAASGAASGPAPAAGPAAALAPDPASTPSGAALAQPGGRISAPAALRLGDPAPARPEEVLAAAASVAPHSVAPPAETTPAETTPAETTPAETTPAETVPRAAAGRAPAAAVERVAASLPGPTRTPYPPARPAGLAAASAPASAPASAAASASESAASAAGVAPDRAVQPADLLTAPDSLASGTRLVQFGAYETPEIAAAEWDRLRARFDDHFEGLQRVIQRGEGGGRSFYRLRAAGFVDAAAARRLCAVLAAARTECVPTVHR